jgi:hypothetical protein
MVQHEWLDPIELGAYLAVTRDFAHVEQGIQDWHSPVETRIRRRGNLESRRFRRSRGNYCT